MLVDMLHVFVLFCFVLQEGGGVGRTQGWGEHPYPLTENWSQVFRPRPDMSKQR